MSLELHTSPIEVVWTVSHALFTAGFSSLLLDSARTYGHVLRSERDQRVRDAALSELITDTLGFVTMVGFTMIGALAMFHENPSTRTTVAVQLITIFIFFALSGLFAAAGLWRCRRRGRMYQYVRSRRKQQ